MVRTQAVSECGVPLLPTIMAAALLAPGAALAALEYNLPPAGTPIARQIVDRTRSSSGSAWVIFVVVFGVRFYSIFKHGVVGARR